MKASIWKSWTGKIVRNTDSGMCYIETPNDQWFIRLKIWKDEYIRDPKTECPAPMPEGHLMVSGKSPDHAFIENKKPEQKELF